MKNTLKRSCDFDMVFSKGKRAISRSLTMIYIKSNQLKVGYCVSKKHGKAVQRNHIKRLLRVAFNQNKNGLGNYYIAIIPKVYPSYSVKKFSEDLKYLISKENLNEDNK